MDVRFLSVTGQLLTGFAENLKLFSATLLFSLPLGLLIALCLLSKFKPLKYLFEMIVWVIRGTPLMLQLFVVFYVPGLVFGVPMRDRFLASLIAFVINYACYFAEIYRGGIISVPHGQYEAGLVLGMNKRQIFLRVTLMQMVKRVIPPMGNEVIPLSRIPRSPVSSPSVRYFSWRPNILPKELYGRSSIPAHSSSSSADYSPFSLRE